MIRRSLALSFVAALFFLCAGPAVASIQIPIVNPDFEADPLPAPGANQPTITGWDTSPGGGDGIFRPTLSDYPDGIPSGENVAYANGPGNSVRQVLGAVYTPNTTYVLKVSVGWNGNDPFVGYNVALRVDVTTVLAQDSSSKSPTQGDWVTSIVQYTTGDTGAELGQPIEIWLTTPGIQANFDNVELVAYAANTNACTETLILPYFEVETGNPNGTNTLIAVRNLTDGPVEADLEYFGPGGSSLRTDGLSLGSYETETVALRNLGFTPSPSDGRARGFAQARTAARADGPPVLGGDFLIVDTGNDFATGNQLVRQSDLCSEASVRFLDFGSGTRLLFYVTQPRGTDTANDPPTFSLQAYRESGEPFGGQVDVYTSDRVVGFRAEELTGFFGTLRFGHFRVDFSNSLGGTVYAEYSAENRFSVGVVAQCEGQPRCNDCCPPGAPRALAESLFYPDLDTCEEAIQDATLSLGSFHYRDACQQTLGGDLPDRVFGARVVDCEVDAPGFSGGVVVDVEACCPLP